MHFHAEAVARLAIGNEQAIGNEYFLCCVNLEEFMHGGGHLCRLL